MRAGIRQKWRPSLGFVVAGTVAGVLVTGIAGLFLLRVLIPWVGATGAVVLAGALVLLAALVLGYLLWRLLLGPVTALAAQARALKSGDPAAAAPLGHYGTREIQHLGQAMLDMGLSLQTRQDQLRAYSAHVTHELKSPLTGMIGAAELLDGDLPEAERAALVTTIRQSGGRMQSLLEALRDMAAAREPLGEGTARLADLLPGLGAAHPGLELAVEGADIPLPIPAQGLEAVLHQLLGNAAAHGAGRVAIRATGTPPGLCLRDDGPGISPGNRDRVFDPFFTTRRDAGGTGMGLAIVQGLLAARGADITLLPDGPGAGFEIRF